MATAGLFVPASSAAVPISRTANPKPTVVLVHGGFADASNWNGVIQRLQRDGYNTIGPGQSAARTAHRRAARSRPTFPSPPPG